MTERGVVSDRSYLIVAALIASIAVVTLFNALHTASNLVQTSDTARGLVVGHAIATDNVLLSGWHFPIGNYYFTDSIPYAVTEAIVGPRPRLMTVVPALVCAALVPIALVLASGQQSQAHGRNILLLAVPVQADAWWDTLRFSSVLW